MLCFPSFKSKAPEDKRKIFRSELQRVGIEAAKVLSELGDKVERMERLSPGNILQGVHQAAEELQMKINEKSFLLVNLESWGTVGPQKEPSEEHENILEVVRVGPENQQQVVINSLSDMGDPLDLGITAESPVPPESVSSDNSSKRPIISWPRLSFRVNSSQNEPESKVYESASPLSLATFMSLLIEFVARLQNLVDAFEELSENANFKDPMQLEVKEKKVRFWDRFLRFVQLRP